MARTAIRVRQAIKNADYIRSRGNATYSQPNRGVGLDSPCYDCSSFVAACWQVSLDGWGPDTTSMAHHYSNWGFQVYQRGDSAYGKLRQGDILVNTGAGDEGHTGMVYNKAATQMIEMTGPEGNPGPVVGNSPWGFTAWDVLIRGSGGIQIVRWTPTDGINDGWHIKGY